jgi:hypothetical protein
MYRLNSIFIPTFISETELTYFVGQNILNQKLGKQCLILTLSSTLTSEKELTSFAGIV